MPLKIAPGFELPDEAVTETFAVLAKRGSGKTYTAAVLAEEILEAGHQVVVVDPIGVWWGLRSSSDGTKAGYPVVIFGGDHADVPLEETAGVLLADVMVDERVPAVLDLSVLSKSAARRFMADFAERLYHRNRAPLHLIIDEADAFAPQRVDPGQQRLLGAIEDLVRRGRARGIGVTMITQRPAVLNKDVLTQAEVLVALRMTGPRDVAAIDEWVRLHADEDEAKALKASLPSLPVGTAWVWSPGWLGVLQRVAVRRRRTLDSSATPKVGERRIEPKRMAEIDLAALGERIAATVERVKADDPKALRRRITELERALATAVATTPVVERVEVPVLDEALIRRLEEAIAPVFGVAEDIQKATDSVLGQLGMARSAGTGRPPPRRPAPTPAPRQAAVPSAPRPATTGDVKLGKAERSILSVLAQYPDGRTHRQVAMLTGYSAKGGGFNNALSALRSKGFVVGGKANLQATSEGLDVLGEWEPLPTGPALLDHWLGQLGKAEKAVLGVLVDAWPGVLSKDEVAVAAGYEVSGGGFNNALSRLRTLELIEGRGDLQASDDFMAGVR